MRLILKLVKPLLINWIKRELDDNSTQSKIVETINSKLDIPKLTEDEEKLLLDQIYDISIENIKLVIDRI